MLAKLLKEIYKAMLNVEAIHTYTKFFPLKTSLQEFILVSEKFLNLMRPIALGSSDSKQRRKHRKLRLQQSSFAVENVNVLVSSRKGFSHKIQFENQCATPVGCVIKIKDRRDSMLFAS